MRTKLYNTILSTLTEEIQEIPILKFLPNSIKKKTCQKKILVLVLFNINLITPIKISINSALVKRKKVFH